MRYLKEAAMSGRVRIVVGMLSCLAFAVGASAFAGETGVPSEQDIGRALHPVPKGLGVHQGLPTLGAGPRPTESPNVHGASLPSDETSPAPNRPKSQPRTGVAASHPQASTERSPAITFNTIQFTFGSAQLTPESSETLRNLGNALNHELADQKAFVIEGHTDAVGSRQVNAVLSRRRAQAVKDYLVRETGVLALRLRTLGKGSSEPANGSDPYAAENRRVVVINTGAS
jgi:OmpA-OmpF porin, OOP family